MILRHNTKSTDNKIRNKQAELHQTKKTPHSKGTINKMKKQWENINGRKSMGEYILKHISDKELTYKIYKNSYNSLAKKPNNPIKN